MARWAGPTPRSRRIVVQKVKGVAHLRRPEDPEEWDESGDATESQLFIEERART